MPGFVAFTSSAMGSAKEHCSRITAKHDREPPHFLAQIVVLGVGDRHLEDAV
jgi:hypothetical protein